MGTINQHLPVKLISAITYRSDFDIDPVFDQIESQILEIENKSEVYEFSKFTSYYEKEMGGNLRKCFMSFIKLIEPEKLPEIKIKTNEIEENYILDLKRQINIDPGYITQAKVVLATTKNYNHRIYLGKGIFGDVHLHYQNNSYQPQPWTYPDYMDKGNIEFFNTIRKRYLEQLASG